MVSHRFLSGVVLLAFLTLLAGCSAILPADRQELAEVMEETRLQLNLVYPEVETGDRVLLSAITDSAFLYGNIHGGQPILIVQGDTIAVNEDGAWLAWIDLPEAKLVQLEGIGSAWMSPVTIKLFDRSHNKTARIVRTIQFIKPAEDTPGSDRVESLEVTLRVNQPFAKIRCGWPGTYDLFPPEGTQMTSTGVKRGKRTFYRVPLGTGEIGWIEDLYVDLLEDSPHPRKSVIFSVRSEVLERNTSIRIALADPVPFRVERISDDQLALTIYGAMSWTDLIIQPFESRVVKEFRWRQLDPATYRLTAAIRPEWFWGWEIDFDEEQDLRWIIREAPELKDRKIVPVVVIDPGHGGANEGAKGALGTKEKDAVLALGLKLKKELTDAGMEVHLTRDRDMDLSLSERVTMIEKIQPDLVLSLHYNGISQGENPFLHHGCSVHYNHSHALPLAESLYEEIVQATGKPGNGVRYQDLAIPRVTGCPSVLIEYGFLLHPEEEKLANSEEFQWNMAEATKKAILRFLKQVKKSQKTIRQIHRR